MPRKQKRPAAVKVPPRPPSLDDNWLDELRAHCAKAMVSYLKAGVNLERPIKSLSKRELEGIAEAVTACWIKQISEAKLSGLLDRQEASVADLGTLLFV